MGVSRTMWERGLRADHAKMARNFSDERKEKVKEISRRWKDGFKGLKEENDRLQLEAIETYHEKMRENDTWLREQLAMGPPQ